jgi:hypothetical protein
VNRKVASTSVRRGNDEAHGKGKRVIKVKNRKCESHWTEGSTAEIRSMAKKYFRGHLDGWYSADISRRETT